MRPVAAIASLLLIVVTFTANDAFACTTFCLKNRHEVLFGKNYDWVIGDGAVFVNRRGVSKWSSIDDEKIAAKWTSKYGSVTFNQYGWESPSGGINEAGLVIELMWLDDTKYPQPDSRPAIDVLEWIQFNLDTASTANEVVANSDKVRIASRVNLHYLVSDKTGHAATIEYLDGKLVAHTGNKLTVAALANDTYERSLKYSRSAHSIGSESSLDRFSRAAARTAQFTETSRTEKAAVNYAFAILDNVAQRNSTQWSIVYDQKRGRIYFRTRKRTVIKSIDTTAFDYSCAAPVKMLDMNADEAGDVTHLFRTYTNEANRDLVERSFNGTNFLRNVPAAARDAHASFPLKFPCNSQSPLVNPEARHIATTVAGVSWDEMIFPVHRVYKYITSS